MRVIVYEPRCTGHYLQYAVNVCNALNEVCEEVVLLLSRSVEEYSEYKVNLPALSEGIKIEKCLRNVEFERSISIMRYLRMCRELIKYKFRFQADYLFVPYGDGMVQASALLFPWERKYFKKSETIMMRSNFAHGRWNLNSILSLLLQLTSPFGRIHQLDPLAYEFIKKHAPIICRKHRVIPEPVEKDFWISKPAIKRSDVGIPAEAFVISIFGGQSKRKGTLNLIRSFSDANLSNAVLMIVGKSVDGSIENEPFLNTNKSIKWINRYVRIEEFVNLMRVSNVVVVPYLGHLGPSGIVVRAAALGIPLLGADLGWIGWAIKKFNLGKTVDVNNSDDLKAAINVLPRFSRTYTPSIESDTFRKYHSLENYNEHVSYRLKSIRDLGHSGAYKSWQSIS